MKRSVLNVSVYLDVLAKQHVRSCSKPTSTMNYKQNICSYLYSLNKKIKNKMRRSTHIHIKFFLFKMVQMLHREN